MSPRRKHIAASVTLATSALLLGACSSSGSNAASSSTTPKGSSTTAGGIGAIGDNPANTADPSAAQAAYTPTGTLIADDGFRPAANAFGTANYGTQLSDGSTPTNLTASDMQKMFGSGVCVDTSATPCTLSPEAQQWMDQTNTMMAGGHCFGFSVAANLLYTNQLKASDFGGSSTPALTITGNSTLQQELAYTWAFQRLPTVTGQVISGTPNDIISKLKQVLVPNPTETYTIAIFKKDGTGGHAVTPYAIEDAGNGIDKILIYDNNYPLVTRAITVDTNANTWTYDAAINPSQPSEVYTGDATTMSMSLYPSTPGLTPITNAFGAKAPAAGQSAYRSANSGFVTVGDTTAMDEIDLAGGDTEHSHVLITDSQGRRLGYVGGKIVNEIPGARFDQTFSDEDWLTTEEPSYYVPDGQAYTITVDGTALTSADAESVDVIAPYFDLSVGSLNVHPGETDTLKLGADGSKWSFSSSQAETPDIGLGISDDTADWAFDVKGDQIPANAEVDLNLPDEGGSLTFGTPQGAPQGSFSLAVDRSDSNGVTHFEHSGISLSGGDSAQLDFGSWTAGQAMQLAVTPAGGSAQDQSLSDQASN